LNERFKTEYYHGYYWEDQEILNPYWFVE